MAMPVAMLLKAIRRVREKWNEETETELNRYTIKLVCACAVYPSKGRLSAEERNIETKSRINLASFSYRHANI